MSDYRVKSILFLPGVPMSGAAGLRHSESAGCPHTSHGPPVVCAPGTGNP